MNPYWLGRFYLTGFGRRGNYKSGGITKIGLTKVSFNKKVIRFSLNPEGMLCLSPG